MLVGEIYTLMAYVKVIVALVMAEGQQTGPERKPKDPLENTIEKEERTVEVQNMKGHMKRKVYGKRTMIMKTRPYTRQHQSRTLGRGIDGS